MGKVSRLLWALTVTVAILSGCSRSTGGGESRYLQLFNAHWSDCHRLDLYETSVESVKTLPDGNRQVVIKYVYDNGMVPDTGHAALLVSPKGRLASPCILDMDIGLCMCGVKKDWQVRP